MRITTQILINVDWVIHDMAKLVIPGKLARALAVIGGRKLSKVVDTLLANVKTILAFRDISSYSDGKNAYIKMGDKTIKVEIHPKEAEISSGYFRFQDGDVVFLGPEPEIRLIKNALLEIAKDRANYLLGMYKSDQLAYYDLTPEYVRNLQKKVDELPVE